MSGDEIARKVRSAVATASQQGSALPGEPTLAQMLGVSRPTVREALVRLEAEGFVRRRKGADTIVNPGAFDLAVRFDQQIEYAEVLRDAGFEPSVEVLEAGRVGLEPPIAAKLGREPGAAAWRSLKRWRADGRTVMVAVDVVAVPDADRLDALDPSLGLFEVVTELTGDVVEWELAWPGAEVVGPPVCGWLEVAAGEASLTLELVGVTRRATRAYYALEFHVPGAIPAGFIRSVRA